jgi:hypothetical protein
VQSFKTSCTVHNAIKLHLVITLKKRPVSLLSVASELSLEELLMHTYVKLNKAGLSSMNTRSACSLSWGDIWSEKEGVWHKFVNQIPSQLPLQIKISHKCVTLSSGDQDMKMYSLGFCGRILCGYYGTLI